VSSATLAAVKKCINAHTVTLIIEHPRFACYFFDELHRIPCWLQQTIAPARNGKPFERAGRKASGLPAIAQGSGATECNQAILGGRSAVR